MHWARPPAEPRSRLHHWRCPPGLFVRAKRDTVIGAEAHPEGRPHDVGWPALGFTQELATGFPRVCRAAVLGHPPDNQGPDWVYWQCVNCGQIDAGDKQTPHGCTQCGADAWRTPPQTAHIDRDSTLD
jgi:hypothetical protein